MSTSHRRTPVIVAALYRLSGQTADPAASPTSADAPLSSTVLISSTRWQKAVAAAVSDILDRREAAGHPRTGFTIQVQARLREGDADSWGATAATWREAGATHMSATTMNAGLEGLDAHLRAIEEWQKIVG